MAPTERYNMTGSRTSEANWIISRLGSDCFTTCYISADRPNAVDFYYLTLPRKQRAIRDIKDQPFF